MITDTSAITITEKARMKVDSLMHEAGIAAPDYFLRVGVKGGGCSGLSYVMDFDDTITDMDEVIDLNVMRVVVDKKSVLYLYGTQLEYSDGLNGKGFHWVNPNASRTCGCGESFSL
jgi:iron-sulfur cluster assembly protein